MSAPNLKKMGVLDNFCRFCAGQLDYWSRQRNIFEPENSHLLKSALECIPLPMSAEDAYPNCMCYPCADKLNTFSEFQTNGLSAVQNFDKYLSGDENVLDVCIKNEFEETEMDFVDEIRPKLEIRSENEIFSMQEVQYQLKKCVVKLTRCDDLLPATEMMPTKPKENLQLGVDEQAFFETETSVGPRKTFRRKAKTPFQCLRCEKSFSQKQHLISHMSVHTGEKPHQCERCEKGFMRKWALTIHKRVHTGEKPFGCEHCHKKFSQKQHLTTHMSVHTGEKPFLCEHCHKKFSQKQHLISHMIIHTGEKPFMCEHCHKKFAHKLSLVLHTRTHTGEKPHKCEYCPKSFSQKGNLVTHTRLHTGGNPYQCEHCQKRFFQKCDLASHIRVHIKKNRYKKNRKPSFNSP